MMRRALVVCGVALIGWCAFAGCSGKGNRFDTDGGDDGGLIGNDDGSFGEGGCAAQTHCSGDLHSILDCNENVLMTCPDDQACGGTGCLPACEGAKANKSSLGCDYYAVDPDIISVAVGACFAAFVANTWTSPVTLTADWGGTPLNIATAARIPSGNGQSLTYQPLPGGKLNPGQVAIIFLNRFGSGGFGMFNFDCPQGVMPGVTAQDGAIHGTGIGKAFHITSDRPVVAYDMFPFGGGQSAATSATLLVPTSAWDVNYIGVNAYKKDQFVAQAQPFLEIVASQDGTQVTISPTAAIVGGNGVAPTGANQPKVYTLNRGQYMQITQDAELSGTPILANKPIGVWGGASCLNIDVNDQACDSAHQQLFPVSALGHEYVLARYRNRFPNMGEESVPWRIVGAVSGTTLSYEPSAPMGAPLSLNKGQVVEFWGPGPYVVRSQDGNHPFYVSAHMTGAERVDKSLADGRGDPEFVNVLPPAEYLASYVFFTDPTYPETNLVVVRKKGKNGFADVTLDCAGTLSGWQPIGSGGTYEYTRKDLVTGNFAKVGNCDNGRHEMRSNSPFGLTVWGWGSAATGGYYSQWVSYAYPAGASVIPINTVVVTPTPN